MGKYAHLISKLPKFVGKDAQSQRIAALAEAIKQEPDYQQQASALMMAWVKLRHMREILDHVESALELRCEALELLTIDQYENEGVLTLKADEGVLFEEALADLVDEFLVLKPHQFTPIYLAGARVQSEPHGDVADKEVFRQWCVKNDLEKSLQLWPSTVQSIVKERALRGDDPPDGVEVSAKSKLVISKG